MDQTPSRARRKKIGSLIEAIARGKHKREGTKFRIEFLPKKLRVIWDKRKPTPTGIGEISAEESWLLSGMEIVNSEDYKLILESAGDNGGVDDPSCQPTQRVYQDTLWEQSLSIDGRTASTHSMLTLYPHEMGATDSCV